MESVIPPPRPYSLAWQLHCSGKDGSPTGDKGCPVHLWNSLSSCTEHLLLQGRQAGPLHCQRQDTPTAVSSHFCHQGDTIEVQNLEHRDSQTAFFLYCYLFTALFYSTIFIIICAFYLYITGLIEQQSKNFTVMTQPLFSLCI